MEKPPVFSETDSLQIIQQMIYTAKQEQKDDGKGWIIWGWMLFSASVLTVINMEFFWFNTFFFWNIFGLITLAAGLIALVKSFIKPKTKKVKTYTQDIFDKLNAGFFIALMVIIVAMNINIRPSIGFPLLMNLYAFWILIYASVLNFYPSKVGAYLMWLLALVALFVHSYQWVMVLHSIGVLVGYIIPGHIANRRFNQPSALKP